MAIVAILVFISMMCAGIYLLAIYALPILAGLAAYSLLKQINASEPTIAVVSIASGFGALASARAGASARSDVIRFASFALLAAPAGYAGYSATLQLAGAFAVPEEWRIVLSVFAALAVSVFAIDGGGRPARDRAASNQRSAATMRRPPDQCEICEPAFDHSRGIAPMGTIVSRSDGQLRCTSPVERR